MNEWALEGLKQGMSRERERERERNEKNKISQYFNEVLSVALVL